MPQQKENKRPGVTRKPVSAEFQAPAVRAIAHETFMQRRPNSDAIARQHGNSRADVQDAVEYETYHQLNRRITRVEDYLGLPPDPIPARPARSVVVEIRRRAA